MDTSVRPAWPPKLAAKQFHGYGRPGRWQPAAPCSTSCNALPEGPETTQHSIAASPVLSRRMLGWSSLAALVCPNFTGARPADAALLDEDVSTKVFDSACQSVVSIINFKSQGSIQVPEGMGTGVIWGGNYVVTNYHVLAKVEKALLSQNTKVVVTDPAGTTSTTYSVELAGSDAMHDLAVLRITDLQADQLPPVRLGRSTDLKVGQYVFAIGNNNTLSAGIVSGLNRSIPSPVGTRIYGAIQTDASINAGNSGGPLLDSMGQMVGLNTATFTRFLTKLVNEMPLQHQSSANHQMAGLESFAALQARVEARIAAKRVSSSATADVEPPSATKLGPPMRMSMPTTPLRMGAPRRVVVATSKVPDEDDSMPSGNGSASVSNQLNLMPSDKQGAARVPVTEDAHIAKDSCSTQAMCVADAAQRLGSLTTLTPVRAKKTVQDTLGSSKVVLTPVRRSARKLDQRPSTAHTEALLELTNFCYTPNKALASTLQE